MKRTSFLYPCLKPGIFTALLLNSVQASFGAINFPDVSPPLYTKVDLGEVSVIDLDDKGNVLFSPDFGETDIWSDNETYELPNEGTWGWQMITHGTALGFYDTLYDYGFVSSTINGEPSYVSFYDIAGNYVSGNITLVNALPDYSYATREGLYVPMVVVTHTHLRNDADGNDVGYDNDYWMMVRLNPNGTTSKMGDTMFDGGALSPTGNYTITYDIATDAAGDKLTRNFTGPYTSYADAVYYTSGYDIYNNPIISQANYTHTAPDGWGTGNLTLTSGGNLTDHKVITNPGSDDGLMGYGVPYTIFDGSGYGLGNSNVLINIDSQPVLANPYFNYTGPTFLTIANSTLTSANLTSSNSTVEITSLSTDSLGLAGWSTNALWLHNTTLAAANITHLSGTTLAAIKESDSHAYLLIAFGLAVDFNRDGDITFDGDDDTSEDHPFVFWINDNVDRSHTVDGNDTEQDSIEEGEAMANSWDLDWTYDTIHWQRDLEDFARLTINAQTFKTGVASGNLAVGLKWVGDFDEDNSPSIKLFQAVEANGGSLYLTDNTTASAQIAGNYANAVNSADGNGTLIAPSSNAWDFVIPTTALGNFTDNNGIAHFLFEGCSPGQGTLKVVLLQKTGNQTYTKLNDGPEPGVSFDLEKITDLYEQWSVGNGNGTAPGNVSLVGNYSYPSPTTEAEQNYILFVHGWNMNEWYKEDFASTAFKRLYWQGYQGRFGVFEWPTTYGFSTWWDAIVDAANFDVGELRAWQSAPYLEDFLANYFGDYEGHVYILAHSMGNVLTGEALRLAARDDLGELVNTYVASQAAITDHAYSGNLSNNLDADVPLLVEIVRLFRDGTYPQTSNVYKNWFSGNSGAAGRRINFYNVNDYALWHDVWELDQWFKPDIGSGQPYYYDFNGNTTVDSDDHFRRATSLLGTYSSLSLGNATTTPSSSDRYEIMALGAQARRQALGNTNSDNGGLDESVNLQSLWPADTGVKGSSGLDYSAHKWHSAEFRSTNHAQAGYWQALLGSNGFNISP